MGKHKLIKLLLFCILSLSVYIFVGLILKKEQIPVPDKIVVYTNNKKIEITKRDDFFNEFSRLNMIYHNTSVMEMCIDTDTIIEIEKEKAVEYIYYNQQNMKIDGQNRSYTRLLFPYFGWCKNSVIFFDEGQYCSGTIKNYVSDKKVYSLFEKIK